MNFPEAWHPPAQPRREGDGARPVTHAFGVTPDLTSRAQNLADIVDKKQLCKRLGWSRPRLDRCLQSDGSFPVLRCGNQNEPWQFEVDAVLVHLEGAGNVTARRRMPAAASHADVPSEVWAELRRELTEVRALRRAVEALLIQLGAGGVLGGAVAEGRHGKR